MSPVSSSLASRKVPLLCYVTDRRSLPVADPSQTIPLLTRTIQQIASAGVDFIQIREKDLSARELALVTREVVSMVATGSGKVRTRILVNDRLDVALAEGAAGVHLGENSLPVAEAKWLLSERASTRQGREGFLVGASCHSVEAAQNAAASGADYLFFGPVFATPSKSAYGMPQGLERLADACRRVSIPVFAIGGITRKNARSCLQAGATGLAAIRLFQDASDPAALVKALRQEFSH